MSDLAGLMERTILRTSATSPNTTPHQAKTLFKKEETEKKKKSKDGTDGKLNKAPTPT
jgi:hypothetical protein